MAVSGKILELSKVQFKNETFEIVTLCVIFHGFAIYNECFNFKILI